MKALLALLALTAVARADARPIDRPIHGSIGIGGTFLVSGDDGDRNRLDVEADIEPGGRFGHYGVLVALRGFDRHHDGILCAGFVFEAAAARPRVVIDLHVDAGVDLDGTHPVAGGGIRTVVGIIGPLGVGLDAGAYLAIAGSQDTRLVVAGDAMVIARW